MWVNRITITLTVITVPIMGTTALTDRISTSSAAPITSVLVMSSGNVASKAAGPWVVSTGLNTRAGFGACLMAEGTEAVEGTPGAEDTARQMEPKA